MLQFFHFRSFHLFRSTGRVHISWIRLHMCNQRQYLVIIPSVLPTVQGPLTYCSTSYMQYHDLLVLKIY